MLQSLPEVAADLRQSQTGDHEAASDINHTESSRINYCNIVLLGLSLSITVSLQHVQNTAAHLVL